MNLSFNRRCYYLIKRLLPQSLRRGLRRLHIQHLREKYGSEWPILESASARPKSWAGWPGGKQFALVLTHDVEGRRGIERTLHLMELERALQFRSSFNFVPEGPYQVEKEVLEYLEQSGFEVGVHGLRHDGRDFFSRAVFKKRAERINKYLGEWKAVGFRAPYMHHNLEWFHDLEIEYDASTFDTDPFEPQPDGVGTIFPFWVPRGDGGGYVELPYTLPQDSTLFIYCEEKSPEIWIEKLDWIAAHGGMALVNVHPDYMNFDGGRDAHAYPSVYYEAFLLHVLEKYRGCFWNPLPREVAAFTRGQEVSVHQNLQLPVL